MPEPTKTTPPPAPQPEEKKELPIEMLRLRIRSAIGGISMKSTTQLRTILDRYPRLLAPSFARDFEAELPRRLYAHGRDRERSALGGYGNVLCFLIGNAIKGLHAADPVVEARVAFLETVAKLGPDQFAVVGTDSDGYALVSIADYRRQRREREEAANEFRDEDEPAKPVAGTPTA